MGINELVKQVHDNAKNHGWWNEPRSMAELLCLIHSEVSEALEEDRNHHEPNETYYSGKKVYKDSNGKPMESIELFNESPTEDVLDGGDEVAVTKPEGIPSELADVVIRVMDICGHYGINLENAITEKMEYNQTRPMKHGGKKL